MNKKSSGIVGGVTLGAILLIGLIVVSSLVVKIKPGYIGVVYSMNGGISGETLTQGWHVISPTKKVTEYSIGLEQSYLTADKQGDSDNDDSFTASSKEGKAIQVELTYTYQFDQERIADVFTRFKAANGTSVRDSFIKPNIVSWTKEVLAKYSVSEILGEKRADINSDLSGYLATKFDPYGILISNASFINFEVDDATAEAIANKINAQQNQERQAVENETAKAKAKADKEVKITQAEADAEEARIQAEAEAEVIRIKAEAEAEANRKIAESLTPELIEKIKYETWDGQLPHITAGGNSAAIIDIPMGE